MFELALSEGVVERNPATTLFTPRVCKVGRERHVLGPAGGCKADIFTERVTLQISPAMRDEAERITTNTVMRVPNQLITKKFKLKGGEAPNNEEEELYKFVEEKPEADGSS